MSVLEVIESPRAADVIECEIFLAINENGNYAVAKKAHDASVRLREKFGGCVLRIIRHVVRFVPPKAAALPAPSYREFAGCLGKIVAQNCQDQEHTLQLRRIQIARSLKPARRNVPLHELRAALRRASGSYRARAGAAGSIRLVEDIV